MMARDTAHCTGGWGEREMHQCSEGFMLFYVHLFDQVLLIRPVRSENTQMQQLLPANFNTRTPMPDPIS